MIVCSALTLTKVNGLYVFEHRLFGKALIKKPMNFGVLTSYLLMIRFNIHFLLSSFTYSYIPFLYILFSVYRIVGFMHLLVTELLMGLPKIWNKARYILYRILRLKVMKEMKPTEHWGMKNIYTFSMKQSLNLLRST